MSLFLELKDESGEPVPGSELAGPSPGPPLTTGKLYLLTQDFYPELFSQKTTLLLVLLKFPFYNFIDLKKI